MIKEKSHNCDVYTIQTASGKTRASFLPERGGVGSSIIMNHHGKEQELLYLHDFFWGSLFDLGGGFPFLFPICGRLSRNGNVGQYLYDGKLYELPIHGFSWWLPWEVVDASSDDALTMRLTSSSETLARYPFQFEVILTYKVSENTLTCHQTYRNLDNKPMPYYAGFHPYFLTPPVNQDKEKVMVSFNPRRRFKYNEGLTDIIGKLPNLNLPAHITDSTINEQLSQLGDDKQIILKFPNDLTLKLQVTSQQDSEMFSYLQLYNIPEKPFFCIEPWMSFPNALNTVMGSRILQPQTEESAVLELSLG